MKKIVILGSTGSVGRQALEVVAANPDRWQVVGLAAGSNGRGVLEQARRFRPSLVALADRDQAALVAGELAALGVKVLAGEEGVVAVAVEAGADLVLSAVVGSAGLRPTYEAIMAGKDIALANKETLVAGGPLVMAAAARRGVRIIPVDSEHSAVFQCLEGHAPESVSRIILTASGGPFRGRKESELRDVTVADALNHPVWRMGQRITIDSATLMNKGLEVIEARWLFGVPMDRIEVVIHPESIVHSLVEMVDGSVFAQLSRPDMRMPIQYALSYPERIPGSVAPLDLVEVGALNFEHPDRKAFPCLDLAYRAGRMGGSMPAAMNAAKEVAVDAFLAGRLLFPGMAEVIEQVMNKHRSDKELTLDAIIATDRWARVCAQEVLERVAV